jgi:hypothetical protein
MGFVGMSPFLVVLLRMRSHARQARMTRPFFVG